MRIKRYTSKKTRKTSEWLPSIFVSIVLAILIRHFLFTPVIIGGTSMMPTLHDNNRVLTKKAVYRLNSVDRFDIVVFKTTEEKIYIKRIIGLPGDHIEYKDDQLYINGKKYCEPYLGEENKEIMGGPLTFDFDIKTLPSTVSEVVPEGYYFVLGDNRRNSKDSRSIGFVSADDIIGKASVVFWPVSEMRIVK